MRLENRCMVPLAPAAAWELLLDLPRVAPCIPGVSEVTDEGEGRFAGQMTAQTGPLRVNLAGTVRIVSQDAAKGAAELTLEAADRRLGGSVRTHLTLHLAPIAENQTQLTITTDTTFGGRLATLGQPIIRRKAAAAIDEFARNLAALLESGR